MRERNLTNSPSWKESHCGEESYPSRHWRALEAKAERRWDWSEATVRRMCVRRC